jgi:lipopolysaccharide/colanic/teichoic acid biosynthesis glycosyltransferase
VLKRLCDILVSAVALIVLSPLLLVLCTGVVLDSGFPIFFSQIRVGRCFGRFRLWKFRSMQTSTTGPSITVSGDRRVTRLGGILRRAKLDELPQFWNVLRGDMSLVGPRPEVPEYVDLFKERYRTILTVRPGITDPASIHFRNEEEILSRSAEPLTEYAERILPAKLDLAEEYVKTRTAFGDICILLRTATSIVRGH